MQRFRSLCVTKGGASLLPSWAFSQRSASDAQRQAYQVSRWGVPLLSIRTTTESVGASKAKSHAMKAHENSMGVARRGVRNHRRWACSFHQNSNTCGSSTNSYSFDLRSYSIVRQSKDFTHVQQSEGTHCFPPGPAVTTLRALCNETSVHDD